MTRGAIDINQAPRIEEMTFIGIMTMIIKIDITSQPNIKTLLIRPIMV